ncbi:Glyoxylase, beta-lactamase superfamily II [Lentzea fradiae]|uniref:Glyoxylase, beta-lactamase superfamily II n=1 Tax=Lentzea fradiae TaxID=200378 RepID=A0A1G7NH58_9PSEU|nr:MBL fold metallo-hydrolase [Lentzea fradiae]SDF73296.1 Glyoxylase, beta-lactamase superfamily II [Lentzea fradiae]
MRKTAEGTHHASFDFGGLTVVALLDGHVDLPASRLRAADGGALDPLPAEVPLVDGRLRLSVNAFLVDDGERRVLVDTGASNSWDPTMGRLPDSLRMAGVDRSAITDVAITHAHWDHLNGLVAPDGSDAFPCLERVFIGSGDEGRLSGELARFRDRAVLVAEPVPVTPWMTALPASGHTPGHTVYEVRSDAGRLLVWGDTVHVPSAQFARPDLVWELDDDQDRARAARAALLARLATPGHFVAGAHLDWPGVGWVVADGPGYRLLTDLT